MADPKARRTAAGGAATPAAGAGGVVGAFAFGAVLVATAIGLGVMRDEGPGTGAEATGAPSGITVDPTARPDSDAAPAAPATGASPALSQTPTTARPSAPSRPGVDDAATVAPTAVGPPQGQDAASADPADALRFDLVRIDPEGNAVIAGRAPPLAEVTLSLDGVSVAVVAADAGGQFVALLPLGPSDVPRLLSLSAVVPVVEGGDAATALAGGETVIIAPVTPVAGASGLELAQPAPQGPVTVADMPMVAGEAAAGSDETASEPSTTLAPAPAPAPSVTPPSAAAPVDVPQAPAVLLADGDGIRVLQSPAGEADTVSGAPPALRLDVIGYDPDGAVTLAGRAPAAGSVRIVLDDLAVATVPVAPDGQWRLVLPGVDPGTYTLRLDTVGPDGSVTRGADTPFLREDPARIRDSAMLAPPGASVITVQPGFTLWGIAEANFGSGVLYVQIFSENRDAIRDPDLIFPGQIFALPDLPRTPGSAAD